MRNEIPPRNWRKYGYGYVGHGLMGAVVAFGIYLGGVFRVLAIVGIAIQLVYQWLEFLRRGDTPGRDTGDIFAGYLVGAGFVSWIVGGRRK